MFGQEDKKGSSVDDVASEKQETVMGKEKKRKHPSFVKVSTKCRVSNLELTLVPFFHSWDMQLLLRNQPLKSCCKHKPTGKNKSYTVKLDLRFFFLSPLVFTQGEGHPVGVESEKFQGSLPLLEVLSSLQDCYVWIRGSS